MVDSIQTVTPVSLGIKPVSDPVPNTGSKKETELKVVVYQGNEPKSVAHLSDEILSDPDTVKKSESKNTQLEETRPTNIENGGEPYSRYYSVEDSEFVLKVYDNQGRLLNKIPPGYLTMEDRDIINFYA